MVFERRDIFKLWLRRSGIAMVTYAEWAGTNYRNLSTAANREPIVFDNSKKERFTANIASKIIGVQLNHPEYIFLAHDEVQVFLDTDNLTAPVQASIRIALPRHVPATYLQLSPEVLKDELHFILETLERIEKERDNRVKAETMRDAFRRFHTLLDMCFVTAFLSKSSAQIHLSSVAPRGELHSILKTLERIEKERGDPHEAGTVKIQLCRLRNLLDTFLP